MEWIWAQIYSTPVQEDHWPPQKPLDGLYRRKGLVPDLDISLIQKSEECYCRPVPVAYHPVPDTYHLFLLPTPSSHVYRGHRATFNGRRVLILYLLILQSTVTSITIFDWGKVSQVDSPLKPHVLLRCINFVWDSKDIPLTSLCKVHKSFILIKSDTR